MNSTNDEGDIMSNLLREIVEINGSDLHIDPYEDNSIVRVRICGILRELKSFTLDEHKNLLARIKAVSGMRLDGFHAQDGRLTRTVDSRRFDLRISILPSYFGESAVLRITEQSKNLKTLFELGYSKEQEEILKKIVTGGGMVLVTGPTGSGKTTTLYSLIQMIMTLEKSIITLEDPVERIIKGIRQIQVNTKNGLTFATGLRSILRQDPEIIMIGEIRDSETAKIAVHSAMTGHLVLSTLHTRSVGEAHIRLIDMGADAYAVSASLKVVISQRLARLEENMKSGYERSFENKGRLAVAEVMEVDNNIKKAIYERKSASSIEKILKDKGQKNIKDIINENVENQKISKEEGERIIRDI
ncbi:MAG: GspE/PulE family protein [bacterium]|nr:GspE/PulE family protein [bacterium]